MDWDVLFRYSSVVDKFIQITLRSLVDQFIPTISVQTGPHWDMEPLVVVKEETAAGQSYKHEKSVEEINRLALWRN